MVPPPAFDRVGAVSRYNFASHPPGGRENSSPHRPSGHTSKSLRAYGMLGTPIPTTRSSDGQLLTSLQWRERARAYVERVQRWTLPHKARRSRHEKHPVHDFLFQYYMYSPGKLERWHPGPTESLVDSPEARERFCPPEYIASRGVISRDPDALSDQAREQLEESLRVMVATQHRPPNFGCYGVHEWAMVYRGADVRHAETTPFRLSQDRIDGFVESLPIACSHFDAFRFFTPSAKPLNRITLEWSTRHEMEQPGCIHANMDLYRWAYTSMPWIGSDLLLDCFELAIELRTLDMQASPYDLRALGFEPVPVETEAGRKEYQRCQRNLSEKATVLRAELVEVVGDVLGE